MCVSLEGGVRNEDRCGQLVQECRHTLNSLQERMLGIESQPRDSSFLETDTGAVEVRCISVITLHYIHTYAYNARTHTDTHSLM